jgi:hypothetical protein
MFLTSPVGAYNLPSREKHRITSTGVGAQRPLAGQQGGNNYRVKNTGISKILRRNTNLPDWQIHMQVLLNVMFFSIAF